MPGVFIVWIETLFAFILGACAGSFLNVCIWRIPAGKSVVSPPSHCPACKARLGFLDLVPVLSYVYLRGRCRRCGAPFSSQYALVELGTGVLFALVWTQFGLSWATPAGWVLVSVLVTAAVIDIHHQIIPNRVLLAGFVLGLPLAALQSWTSLTMGLLAFLAAGLFLLAVAVVSRGGMGGGDVKLAALMGLYLGPAGVAAALFLAFLTGGAAAIALLATGRKTRKDPVPFGPYLALGGVAALLWGGELVGWYAGLWR
jgi:leader peptidase (prepilin peptidase)/N-methyltransferase